MSSVQELIRLDEEQHDEAIEQQRFKELRIMPEILTGFLITKLLRIDSELPDNVAVVNCEMEDDHIVLTLVSNEFLPVPEGQMPPRIDPREIRFTRLE